MSDVEMLKQFDVFSKSVQDALAMFNNQEALVKVLQGKVAELEQKVVDNLVFTSTEKNSGFGFEGKPKQAKDFVTMIKGIYNRDDAMVKDLVEGRDPDGGYLVQTEYRNTLMSLIEQYGMARQQCTVIPMKTIELTMPKLTGGVQVYWIGEGQTIPTTQPTFGEFRMTIKKLAALVPMTSELLDDTSVAIANLLATLFAQAIAKEEDRIVFTGNVNVSDPFNGVLYDPGVRTYTLPATKTAFTDITVDQLADITSMQTNTLSEGAKFYMHRTMFNILRQKKDKEDNYIWSAPTAGNQPGMIWGYPYELVESMPAIGASGAGKPFLFFGNLKHYYIGDRKQLTVARSEHVGFTQDKIFLRILQREGMAYALPETGVVIKTAAS